MRELSTISTKNFNGVRITVYNTITENKDKLEFEGKIYDGFYISYNNHDVKIYGDKTTALVLGQMVTILYTKW